MKRKLKIGIITILLITVAVVLSFNMSISHIIKSAIETNGAKVLGTDVKLDKVNVSMFTGAVTLDNVTIVNLPGYQLPNFLTMHKANAEVSTGTLLNKKKKIRIKNIELAGINLTVEQKGSETNLQKIIEAVSKYKFSDRNLWIDELKITDVTITIALPGISGKDNAITFKLQPVTIRNIGKDEDLDTAMVLNKILAVITDKITQKGADIIPKDLLDTLSSALNNSLLKLSNDIIKSLKDLFTPGSDK